MPQRNQHPDDSEQTTGHGFDLAAAAAQGPLVGSDQTNGIVDLTEDEVEDEGSPYGDALRRTGQANIAGLGGVGF